MHTRLMLPWREVRNGSKQQMIRIGNVMYASNQDAQSGVMARLVSKGRGAKGAYLRKRRVPTYTRPTNTIVSLSRIDRYISSNTWVLSQVKSCHLPLRQLWLFQPSLGFGGKKLRSRLDPENLPVTLQILSRNILPQKPRNSDGNHASR